MNLGNYHFVYNAAAHFAAGEKYPEGLMSSIVKPGTEGFDALCWALEELSTQAELIRRDMGRDKETPLKAETVKRLLMPYQLEEAKKIVFNAIVKGLNPGGEDEEIDEVLMENQKKTESD
jgi:hypothetical protein